ncbi:MAG: pullulanase-associated domain-containing protein, partial [Sphingomonadaceae bacterium]
MLLQLAACGAGADQAAPVAASAVKSGAAPRAGGSVPLAPATLRVHYHRAQNDTALWGVYAWDGPLHPSSTWITDRLMLSSSDSFGGYVDIPIQPDKTALSFLLSDG